MLTISDELIKIILKSPLLEEELREGLINLSALARKMRPDLQKKLLKPVSESAVLMALKRLIPKISKTLSIDKKISQKAGNLSVKSNLMEFTFKRSATTLNCIKSLLHELEQQRDNFITFTQGIYEITVIADYNFTKNLKEIFSKEVLISSLSNLSAISIRLTPETVYTSGIYYSILKQLAWHNLNIVEVVSTLTEFSIILKKKDIDSAFSILLKFLS